MVEQMTYPCSMPEASLAMGVAIGVTTPPLPEPAAIGDGPWAGEIPYFMDKITSKSQLTVGEVHAEDIIMSDSCVAQTTVQRSTTSGIKSQRSRGMRDGKLHGKLTASDLRSASFFIVKRKDGDFTRVSPFVIEKVISSSVGAVRSMRKVRDGLLVEVSGPVQAQRIVQLSKFDNFDVEVTPHGTLNTSKGVVTCRDLLNCTIDEIITELRSQNVIDARRITTMRDGIKRDTASCVLTFNTVRPPDKIKAGFYSLLVRPYIPSPLRCFNCQKFGHTAVKCTSPQVCVFGRPPHDGTECDKSATCPNCDGNHSARSRDCTVYKREVAIQRFKTLEKCSYAEARRKVSGSNRRPTATYAEIAKPTKPDHLDVNEFVKLLLPEIKNAINDEITSHFQTLSHTTTTKGKPMIPKSVELKCPSLVSDSYKKKGVSSFSRKSSGDTHDRLPMSEQYLNLGRRCDEIVQDISRGASPELGLTPATSKENLHKRRSISPGKLPSKRRINDRSDLTSGNESIYSPSQSLSAATGSESETDNELFTDKDRLADTVRKNTSKTVLKSKSSGK